MRVKIELISKYSITQVSKNVNATEIRCFCDLPDCYVTMYSPDLLNKFEILRRECGDKPIIITSAYRCQEHNRMQSGRKKSKHKIALALDSFHQLE